MVLKPPEHKLIIEANKKQKSKKQNNKVTPSQPQPPQHTHMMTLDGRSGCVTPNTADHSSLAAASSLTDPNPYSILGETSDCNNNHANNNSSKDPIIVDLIDNSSVEEISAPREQKKKTRGRSGAKRRNVKESKANAKASCPNTITHTSTNPQSANINSEPDSTIIPINSNTAETKEQLGTVDAATSSIALNRGRRETIQRTYKMEDETYRAQEEENMRILKRTSSKLAKASTPSLSPSIPVISSTPNTKVTTCNHSSSKADGIQSTSMIPVSLTAIQRQQRFKQGPHSFSHQKSRRRLVSPTEFAPHHHSSKTYNNLNNRDNYVVMTPADIADHPSLYQTIDDHNITHWVGACRQLLVRYIKACKPEHFSRQEQAETIIQLLRLPAAVLAKPGRGGKGKNKGVIKKINNRLMSHMSKCQNSLDTNETNLTIAATTTTTTEISPSPSETTDTALAHSITITTANDIDTNADTDINVTDTVETSINMPLDPSRVDPALWDLASHENDINTNTNTNTDIMDNDNDHDDSADTPTLDNHDRAAMRARTHAANTHLQRAARTLSSDATLLDTGDSDVQEKLKALHPPLPSSSSLPPLPSNAPTVTVPSSSEMKRILESSDNGAAPGPSGWGGNMVSILTNDDICVEGMSVLITNIINGDIPDEVRAHLISCRLVALGKKDNGVRPIAVGELFYRVAAAHAACIVRDDAAELLAPHQYGVGVNNGCTKIIHNISYSLTTVTNDTPLACLSVDFSNAFNTIDRSKLLKDVYSNESLSPIYRLVHFAYNNPSPLLLSKSRGVHLESRNGVRQGDPLSSLLFSLGIKDILDCVSRSASITLYAYIDDLQIVGSPTEVMKAFHQLQLSIGGSGLTINHKKSSFIYFHHHTHPLDTNITNTLQQLDIPIIKNRVVMLGAVIGKNIHEIQAGVRELIPNLKTDLFFTRLTNPHLGVQTAMILLRYCGIPKMNYLLKVIPPDAIATIAKQFDDQALAITHKLLETEGEAAAHTEEKTQQLQAPLRYGGFGITSAAATSHTAYLASVACAATSPVSVLRTYTTDDHPLPQNTMLHSSLTECITTIKTTTPTTAEILPLSADNFFSYYEHECTIPVSTLQSTINQIATKHLFNATIGKAEANQDITTQARWRSITAPHAADWKDTLPSNKHMILADHLYRISVRMNLGLPISDLPADCHGCGTKNQVAKDPYHYLSCTQHKRREITLGHDMVVHTLARFIHMTGGCAVKEPHDLHDADGRRPDLQMITNNEHIITDVQITSPLCPTNEHKAAKQTLAAAKQSENRKINKYMDTAKQHHATFIPFVMEATGGMSKSAQQIYEKIVLASRDSGSLWPHEMVARELRGCIAIAIQRRNGMTMIAGRVLAIGRAATSIAA
jgi:hypothetical protein